MLPWLLVTAGLAGEPGFDHTYATLAKVYEGAVADKGVDYDRIATRRSELDAALAAIAVADLDGMSKPQKIALYTNAYNAYTIRLILDHRPLDSIRDLDGGNPWKTRTFGVGGEELTLDQIEHQRLRPMADGRIHAVVNCASMGCPPLPPEPMRPDTLDAQLDVGARRWVRTNAYVMVGRSIRLSKIFDWYQDDFTPWRTPGHPYATEAQDAGLNFLLAFGLDALPEHSQVAWHVYDWSLNDVDL